MFVLGLDGAIPESFEIALRRAMAARGRVGVIELEAESVSGPGDETVVLARTGSEGGWELMGKNGSLGTLLDDLAPRCEYALVYGLTDSTWPTIRVEDDDLTGDLIPEPVDATAVDVNALIDALEEGKAWETLQSLVARAKRSPDAGFAGAIATFTGQVRAKEDPEDTATEYLEFEKYAGVADEQLARIRRELLDREGVYEVLLHHRTGVVRTGVDIVFVVVLAGHREEAFRTVEDGINRLKAEVPIFKKEVTVDDTYWVHTRP